MPCLFIRQRMPTRVAVILNAASGSGDKTLVATQIEQAFATHGITPAIELTEGKGVCQAAQRALDAGIRVIVAAGGDGTISGVSSVVAATDAALGVLPLGTLNHFAKDLGIPLELDQAVSTIASGHAVMVDIGDANGRRFINNFSVGLYPSVVLERERRRKNGRRKSIAFGIAMLQVWREYRRVRVVLQNGNRKRIVRTPFVFVGNNEYGLKGVTLGGRTSLCRGHLHVCMAPEMTRAEVATVLLSTLAGRLQNVEHFESFRTTEFSIDAHRQHLAVSLDGELAVVNTPIRFRILPSALRVLVPEDDGTKRTDECAQEVVA